MNNPHPNPLPMGEGAKTIVITGATGALGKKTAQAFAERGHSLVLFGNDREKMDSLVRDSNLPSERLHTAILDLRDGQAVHSAGEVVSAKFGGVHGLIHLIGGWLGGKTIPETAVDDFDSMLGQHVWTTIHLFQTFMPLLEKSKWGRVITVSPSGVSSPLPKRGAYTAAKAAQETLMLTLAAELKESNVTANIIQVKAIDVEGKGIGATPEEIVAAILYLFSDDAGKVTGAKLPLY
ncbi:MAG: SDR family oxidoreductase [Anaerolineales bacterium]|nr:MAG: SDR family oxidoreductase [Anaerolineales bacterium]